MRRHRLNPFTSDLLGVKLVLGLVFIFLSLAGVVRAQLSITVKTPSGETMDVTGKNMARGDEALIVFDHTFGKTTRTNPYGVEVTIVPAPKNPGQYRVTKVDSVWECQTKNNLDACGNAEIPAGGFVLSATGSKRDVLKNLKPGDLLSVEEAWFQQRTADINVINPSPENNPGASGFPGYRGSNQLLAYNAGYGKPTTGTNEFGFEVTVENNRVVAQEGSDSAIPAQNGFVLSGHGKGRSWLIANAPIGAKVFLSPDGKQVTSTIDFDTYAYQYDQQWKVSPCAADKLAKGSVCKKFQAQRDHAALLNMQGRTNEAIQEMTASLDALVRHTWKSYQAFPATTVKGVWHRPVEKNRPEIARKLDMLKEAGLNSVFLETYFHGYTIFPSETFKAYGLPEQNPKFAGNDLLKLWVEEAHKRNMKVHVWFQTFYAGTKAYLPPGPVLAKYPQWANIQYAALIDKKPPAKDAQADKSLLDKLAEAGKSEQPLPPSQTKETPKQPVASNLELGAYFLDPANPDVQDFVRKLSLEIVTRYNVDGFQLDYIRYPASFPPDRYSFHKTTWGYTPVARAAFKAKYGVDPVDINPKKPEDAAMWKSWNDFKTAQVSTFVERVTHEIRQKNPKVKISAAIFPEAESALVQKHQDWVSWAKNGWVDFLAPMTLTSAVKIVERDTRYLIQTTNGKVPVYSGLFGPFNDNTADQVLMQIEGARSAGATGFVLFDSAHLTGRMLEALQLTQNKAQAVK